MARTKQTSRKQTADPGARVRKQVERQTKAARGVKSGKVEHIDAAVSRTHTHTPSNADRLSVSLQVQRLSPACFPSLTTKPAHNPCLQLSHSLSLKHVLDNFAHDHARTVMNRMLQKEVMVVNDHDGQPQPLTLVAYDKNVDGPAVVSNDTVKSLCKSLKGYHFHVLCECDRASDDETSSPSHSGSTCADDEMKADERSGDDGFRFDAIHKCDVCDRTVWCDQCDVQTVFGHRGALNVDVCLPCCYMEFVLSGKSTLLVHDLTVFYQQLNNNLYHDSPNADLVKSRLEELNTEYQYVSTLGAIIPRMSQSGYNGMINFTEAAQDKSKRKFATEYLFPVAFRMPDAKQVSDILQPLPAARTTVAHSLQLELWLLVLIALNVGTVAFAIC